MIINFPSILFDRRAKRSRIVPTINKIIPPPPFESGKRYPQNVSINSNFTVDESFEARNVGFALSSETGCFSSRLRDERRNAMHLSWRRCFPETWGKHLSFPTPTGRARSLKLEKRRGRGGGGGQVNRKGSRGRRVRVRTKRWYSYFPSDKANNRFLGNPSALAHCSSSLRAATKGGNAGRGGKREWDEFGRFLAAFRPVPLSPSRWGRSWPSFCLAELRERSILEGRTSVSSFCFAWKKKKKKKRRIFSSHHRLRFCFHRDVFWDKKRGKGRKGKFLKDYY